MTPDEIANWAVAYSNAATVDRVPPYAWDSLADVWNRMRPAPVGGDPFTREDGSVRLTTSVVAYVDELGATARIEALTDDAAERWRSAVASALGWFDPNNSSEVTVTFSDNTVVAYPMWEPTLPTDPSSQIGALAATIAGFQLELLLTEMTLHRGGLVVGPVFAEPNRITGQGLVEAVKLEEQRAVYPRVVVSQTCRDLYWPPISSTGKGRTGSYSWTVTAQHSSTTSVKRRVLM